MNNRKFEEKIKYTFKNKELLETALTHSSYNREHADRKISNNERLEFIGDAFFDAVIGVELYKRLSKDDEGRLTKTRALIVCEKSLAKVGLSLDIGSYINMGHGEELSGGRRRESLIADAMEAVIGAIFLDGGYDETERFITREFSETVDAALAGKLFADYKTTVQELLQKGGHQVKLSYIIDKEEGPDHDKTFYVHMVCNGIELGKGVGKSKKEAEQNAAKDTLERRLTENVF